VIGSAVAFGVTLSALTFLYMLLLGFVGIYNNFTADPVEQYVLVFGLFGLIFGLLTGILQALMSLRLKDAWRPVLASTVGFTLGGMVMGILVRLVNPTAGFQTAPVLTWIVLLLALATPFALGGGALGYTYGRLAKRAAEKDELPEALQPSGWQTGIMAVIGLLAVFWFLGIVDHITDFVTIRTANTQTVISRETVGVQWSDPEPYDGDIDFAPAPSDAESPVSVTAPDGSMHSAWCTADGVIQYQLESDAVESITVPGCSGAPALALGSGGQPHLVWYATEIRDTTGVTRADSLLVESIRTGDGWSEASIIARPSSEAAPVLSADAEGNLLLVWEEANQGQLSATQAAYACDSGELSYWRKRDTVDPGRRHTSRCGELRIVAMSSGVSSMPRILSPRLARKQPRPMAPSTSSPSTSPNWRSTRSCSPRCNMSRAPRPPAPATCWPMASPSFTSP
jgi:hypothetical protein